MGDFLGGQRKAGWWVVAMVGAVLGWVAPVRATNLPLNLSTGWDASNTLITTGGVNDGHWRVNDVAARVTTPSNADWWGGWAANDANSDWIAEDPNSNSGNGTGTYSYTFDLTGVNLSTVEMSGRWAVDDEGTLSINGHQIGAYQVHDGWQNWATQTFDVTNAAGWFNQGNNALTLNVAASDNFFEAVRLQGTLTGSVPEPSGLGMMALGAVAMLGRSRRGVRVRQRR